MDESTKCDVFLPPTTVDNSLGSKNRILDTWVQTLFPILFYQITKKRIREVEGENERETIEKIEGEREELKECKT